MPALEPTKLMILWTSADREVALDMMLMYAVNAAKHGWWEHVTLIIWGPSQRLFVEDGAVRAEVERLQEAGGRVLACVSCSDRYGLTEALKSHGVEVFGMGAVLTNWLKSGGKILTF